MNDAGSQRRLRIYFSALLGALFLFSTCATPIGVVRGTTQDSNFHMTANVFSAGEPSIRSLQALQRSNLAERFHDDHAAALGELRKAIRKTQSRDQINDGLFALSELSFYFAEQSGERERFLAAAVYAYAFPFPEDGTPPPDPLDPRHRLAADLNNLGLVRGLESPDGEEVVLQDAKLGLPFGELDLTLESRQLNWGGFRFTRFMPVDEFEVRGLRNRYRQALKMKSSARALPKVRKQQNGQYVWDP